MEVRQGVLLVEPAVTLPELTEKDVPGVAVEEHVRVWKRFMADYC